MHELSTTRFNEQIDPVMHVWGWEIPVYLFLGGLVAGTMIIIGYLVLTGKAREKNSIFPMLPVLGIVLLSLGMFALFLDLEHKLYVWRLYTTFQPLSPMSWGAWILILVYPALILGFLYLPPFGIEKKFPIIDKVSRLVSSHPLSVKVLSMTNIFLGALLGIYTGVLLSSLSARPLWNTPLLWLLFLLSGLSSAAALIHMLTKNKAESELLAKVDNHFLTAELFVIALLIIGALSSGAQQIAAIHLLITGAFAPVFWTFVIICGIILPLIIQNLAVRHIVVHTPVAPILVLLGGLVLRFVIVSAGQLSHWNIVIK